jgi:hypothetical protein
VYRLYKYGKARLKLLSVTLSFSKITVPIAMIVAGAIVGASAVASHDINGMWLSGIVIGLGFLFGVGVYIDQMERYG